jgi:hypothetical protein
MERRIRVRLASLSVLVTALASLGFACGGGGTGSQRDGGGTDGGGSDGSEGGTDTGSNVASVTFTIPAPGQNLCNINSTFASCVPDADGTTAGWQGSLAVHVTAGGAPVTGVSVTFATTGTTLGSATLDANGDAKLTGVTIQDITSITISATTADIPGFGVAVGTIHVSVDTTVPSSPPTGLTASVVDRRQTSFRLNWTAPSDNGVAAVGYQIRAATVPIDSTNFDAPGTVVVPYSGTPAAPNAADTFLAKNLVIENSYYFAIAATDSAGNRSPIAVTSSTARAAFMTTTLSGQAASDHSGYSIDGTGDFGSAAGSALAKDGFSDLVVGNLSAGNSALNTAKVYIYFGSSSGYPATPSVTINGTANGFGTSVVNAGDIDGDGLDDIAISSPNDGTGKVFIFSRKNPTWATNGAWPSTPIMDSQANYTITTDSSYMSTFFGQTLASAPSFEGASGSDLVIGTPGYNGNRGQVLLVKGGASFSAVTLPSATKTTVITGGAAMDLFGFGLVDIGPFAGATTTSLLGSATGASAVYAFEAQALSATNDVSVAFDSTIFTPTTDAYGAPLSLIGPVGASANAVAIGAIGFFVDVHLGNSATGPLAGSAGGAPAPAVRFTNSAAGNSWGVLALGSAVPGKNQSLTLIAGDAIGDLVMAGQAETGNPIYLVSGADLASMTGMVDVTTAAKVAKAPNHLPSDWRGYAGATIIPDSDGDGYSDFAVGEFASTGVGRVVVFH